jgi:putative NADH-flavin reductase
VHRLQCCGLCRRPTMRERVAQNKTFLVFGGTGQTGQHFVSIALQEGHSVRALARTPSKFGYTDPDLEVHQGSITDVRSVDELVKDTDFVIATLGDAKLSARAEDQRCVCPRLDPGDASLRHQALSL